MAKEGYQRTIVVPLLDLDAGPDAVRLDGDDPTLADLAASIREIGLINALSVRREGDRLVVVAGHRRYAACRMAGVVEVPVVVYEGSRGELGRVVFAENFHRADISPIEQAHAIATRLEAGDMDEATIARTFGRSVRWVHDQVAMLAWPVEILEAVHGGQLSRAGGEALAQITDDAYREFLVRQAVGSGASGRVCQAWLEGWQASLPPEEAVELVPADPAAPAIAPTPRTLCLVCGQAHTYDMLSNVLICHSCVGVVRTMAERARAGEAAGS